jgi:putative transposase
MARKPRIHYPGALYHVTLRGNSGQTIFFDDRDRTRFCFLVQQGIERFAHRIHAFCWMTNHVHLAIQVGDISLSRILQNLSFRYTRWINWRQIWTGHLFQGRYKAVLVDADAYLLELTRYIHLNPVRAGIVKEPEGYPWSGHRTYLGLETIPWLTTDWVLSQFSGRFSAARRAYGRFVSEGKEGGHQRGYYSGSETDNRILGDDTFVDRVLGGQGAMQRLKATLDAVVKEVCQHYSVMESDLEVSSRDRRLSEARGMAAWLILELGVCTLRKLGKRVGRDVTTLSSAAKRLLIRAKKDSKLARKMKELLKTVS